jgi:hypothetical protein
VNELEDLEEALRKRDKFSVDKWFEQQSGGRVQSLKSDVYEDLAFRAQIYSFPELMDHVPHEIAHTLQQRGGR